MSDGIGVRKWRVWLWSYAPLFVWIAVIFLLSSDSGSMSNTSRFVRPILVFLFPTADETTLLFYHGIVRKLAHFTEYAILGALAIRALERFKYRYILAVSIVIAVAFADEIGQSFRPSRTASIIDVGIDIAGGLVMITALYLYVQMGSSATKKMRAEKRNNV
ncbi:MAG: VanZ family protein [Blastocatellia bacterium]|nr:VanZ family protein [Blastocatellia bacterium]